MGSHGTHYHALLGKLKCFLIKGMCNGQIFYFKLLSACLNSGRTNNHFPRLQAPCAASFVHSESNYSEPNNESISFYIHFSTARSDVKEKEKVNTQDKI